MVLSLGLHRSDVHPNHHHRSQSPFRRPEGRLVSDQQETPPLSRRLGTFMYIPHENSNVRSLHMTRRSIITASAAGLGAVLAFVGIGAFAFGPDSGNASPAVAGENVRLKQELSEMEGEVATLGQQLESLLAREEELRLVADLPPVPMEVQAVGVGGP